MSRNIWRRAIDPVQKNPTAIFIVTSVFLKIEETIFFLTVSSFETSNGDCCNLINRPPPDISGHFELPCDTLTRPLCKKRWMF